MLADVAIRGVVILLESNNIRPLHHLTSLSQFLLLFHLIVCCLHIQQILYNIQVSDLPEQQIQDEPDLTRPKSPTIVHDHSHHANTSRRSPCFIKKTLRMECNIRHPRIYGLDRWLFQCGITHSSHYSRQVCQNQSIKGTLIPHTIQLMQYLSHFTDKPDI